MKGKRSAGSEQLNTNCGERTLNNLMYWEIALIYLKMLSNSLGFPFYKQLYVEETVGSRKSLKFLHFIFNTLSNLKHLFPHKMLYFFFLAIYQQLNNDFDLIMNLKKSHSIAVFMLSLKP